MSDVDYKAVVEQLQIENEVLRNTVKVMAKEHTFALPKPDFSWLKSMSWEERYFAIAAVCSVIIALVSIVHMVRGEE